MTSIGITAPKRRMATSRPDRVQQLLAAGLVLRVVVGRDDRVGQRARRVEVLRGTEQRERRREHDPRPGWSAAWHAAMTLVVPPTFTVSASAGSRIEPGGMIAARWTTTSTVGDRARTSAGVADVAPHDVDAAPCWPGPGCAWSGASKQRTVVAATGDLAADRGADVAERTGQEDPHAAQPRLATAAASSSYIDDERREAHEVEHLAVVRARARDDDRRRPVCLASMTTEISTEMPDVLMYCRAGQVEHAPRSRRPRPRRVVGVLDRRVAVGAHVAVQLDDRPAVVRVATRNALLIVPRPRSSLLSSRRRPRAAGG